jgi:hypothetical protein
MQNISPPPQLSPAAAQPLSDVLERVLGVAAPPLAPGESEAQYLSLAARVVAAAKPRDTIEELLIRDVIDLTWDVLRLRRIKSGILKANMNEGVQEVMSRLGYGEGPNYAYPREIGQSWAAGDKSAKKDVARALAAAGLAIDDVTATTLERNIDKFERIERMLASAEARRNNALREIDRHRSAYGAAIRRTLDEVEDVEFRDVESGEVAGGTKQ